jgi:hypothetical protein
MTETPPGPAGQPQPPAAPPPAVPPAPQSAPPLPHGFPPAAYAVPPTPRAVPPTAHAASPGQVSLRPPTGYDTQPMPYAPQQPVYTGRPVASGLSMKRRNVAAVWIGLPLITLGIYTLVWWYSVNAEMAAFDRRRPVSPALTLLAMFLWCLIVPPFVAVYRTGERIGERQRAAGLASSCNGWIGVLLLFLFGLTTLYYQSELNKIVDRYGNVPPGTQVPLYA